MSCISPVSHAAVTGKETNSHSKGLNYVLLLMIKIDWSVARSYQSPGDRRLKRALGIVELVD